jgi:cell division protein FtsB
MAIIGARPATGIGVLRRRPRTRRRPEPRPRPRARRLPSGREALNSLSAVLVAIAAAVGLGLFYLSQSTHVSALGYQIDRLQAQVENLRAEQQSLTFQIGAARSPSTIETRAKAELSLVTLDSSVVRFAIRPVDPRVVKLTNISK